MTNPRIFVTNHPNLQLMVEKGDQLSQMVMEHEETTIMTKSPTEKIPKPAGSRCALWHVK